jgi:ribosome maturation factor RimP
MKFKVQVENLLSKSLDENPSLFLIDIKFTFDNKIKIILDGDDSVSLKDCIKVSRDIEFNLDRDEIDFSLEVSSVAADSPLVKRRQYLKNIGRKLSIEDSLGKDFEGILKSVGESEILIEWKERQPKKIGKGKETVIKKKNLSFSEITQAKVILKF